MSEIVAGTMRQAGYPIYRVAIVAVLVLGFFSTHSVFGQDIDRKAAKIKTAYVFNLAKEVEFPSGAAGGADNIVVGILGQEMFGDTIDSAMKGKQAQGKSIEIKRLAGPGEAASCHIVVISESEKGNAGGIKDAVAGKGTLLVGDFEGFAAGGGHVNFTVDGNKIKIEVNTKSASESGIKFSARLMKVATEVGN